MGALFIIGGDPSRGYTDHQAEIDALVAIGKANVCLSRKPGNQCDLG